MLPEQLRMLGDAGATPAYIFDLDTLHTRMAAIRARLDSKIRLCFALKANPFLAGELGPAVTGYEVCSPGELAICKRAEIDPKSIIFSGVNKTLQDIEQAIGYGCGLLTAESPKHFYLIHGCAQKHGQVCDVLLRLSSRNQFGMDKAAIENIISRRNDFPNVNITGIHYFAGTQRKKTAEHLEELASLSEWFRELENRFDFSVPHFEYGPGLGVRYFITNPDNEMQLLGEISATLAEMAETRTVMVEMGRFFVASCGSYVTRIDDVKESDGVRYIIVDGGIHHLSYSGQNMGMHRPFFDHIGQHSNENSSGDYMICGSLCTTNDILIRNASLCDPREGDLLVFHNAGAYAVTEGISLLLSRALPRVYFNSVSDELVLARDFFFTDTINYSKPDACGSSSVEPDSGQMICD